MRAHEFLFESAVRKAGFLPYFINEDGTVEFLFFLSSNPQFGGDRFAVAKGGIDPGESPQQAGVREAEEELGLLQSNLVPGTVTLGWQGEITGLDATYGMAIFIGEVKSKENFGPYHYETAETKWMTYDQFAATGRQSQVGVVASCAKAIKRTAYGSSQ